MGATITSRPLDIAAIVVYLGVLAAMGIHFSRKKKTAESYFVGNRAFPGWAVGLSMFATSISSVTFLAFPAAAYVLDWRQLVPNLTLPIVAVVAMFVFLPFFRQGRFTSGFEYLEARYGPAMRLYGAIIFIFMQFVRLGTVLYLVSIPVSMLTGIGITKVILAIGLALASYTVLGGIEAVIWVDVVQAAVKIIGGILPMVFIAIQLPGGLGQIVQVGMEHHKFSLGDPSWDLSKRTLAVMILIGLSTWLNEYSGNQNVIQRYVAAASTREARKAIAVCTLTSVPIWVFFFFLGTSLFVYYRVFPDPGLAAFAAEPEKVLPYFILTGLPAGVAGMVTAGLLAATMSLDSSINSVATVTVVDIIRRHVFRGRSDAFYLRAAKAAAMATAGLMIGGAVFLSKVPKESMVDLGLVFVTVFAGAITSAFLVGFLTTRVNYVSATLALGLTLLFNAYLVLCAFKRLPPSVSIPIHRYWIGILVSVFFAFVAYVISLFGLGASKPMHRLTVWTMTDDKPEKNGELSPPRDA